jgi:hypothetical protein
MPAACWRRNSVQLASTRFGAGSISALLKDRPDSARRQPDAEPEEFALDPPVAPARVLAREAHDELTDVSGGRGPTGAAVRIRPAARDEFAVPPQQRRGRHEQRRLPGLPWQHAAKCRQQRPIRLRQLRTRDLAL